MGYTCRTEQEFYAALRPTPRLLLDSGDSFCEFCNIYTPTHDTDFDEGRILRRPHLDQLSSCVFPSTQNVFRPSRPAAFPGQAVVVVTATATAKIMMVIIKRWCEGQEQEKKMNGREGKGREYPDRIKGAALLSCDGLRGLEWERHPPRMSGFCVYFI